MFAGKFPDLGIARVAAYLDGRDDGEPGRKPQVRGQVFIEGKPLHAIWTTEKLLPMTCEA